jgi:hypothetical protein
LTVLVLAIEQGEILRVIVFENDFKEPPSYWLRFVHSLPTDDIPTASKFLKDFNARLGLTRDGWDGALFLNPKKISQPFC